MYNMTPVRVGIVIILMTEDAARCTAALPVKLYRKVEQVKVNSVLKASLNGSRNGSQSPLQWEVRLRWPPSPLSTID